MSQSKYFQTKYAIIPVRNYIYNIPVGIRSYVVGKCFFCGEHKHFTNRGEVEMGYDVVFMWDPNNRKDNIYPQYELETNRVTNITEVDKIYNTASECQAEVDKLNESLLDKNSVDYGVRKREIAKDTQEAQKRLAIDPFMQR